MAGFKFGSDHRTRIDVETRQLFDVAPMRDDNHAPGRLTYFGLVALPVLPRATFEAAVDVGGAIVCAAAALVRRTPG